MPERVIAIDAGTTGIRVNAYDKQARRVETAYREFAQHFPEPGWVEHDAAQIWTVTRALLAEVVAAVGGAGNVSGIGITNQRETCLYWDRETHAPLGRAIVWQDRRTRDLCEKLRAEGKEPLFRERTGLLLDAYFSGTKARWLRENAPEIGRRLDEAPEGVAFGTIDTWLAYRLSGGRAHVTDPTNASRTLLFDIDRRAFTAELCELLRVPLPVLPKVVGSAAVYGETAPALLGAPVPLCGLIGDQQSALFGQGCWEPGTSKNTYGTGCFALLNCGPERPAKAKGILTTIACDAHGQPVYALEGSVFIGGAVVQWLRDGLKLIGAAEETAALAASVPDTGGVYLVPAFTGLGAPYWEMDARGAILGITRGTGIPHIIRAALESICYQSRDLLEALEAAAGTPIDALRIDGGAVANEVLCQLQADLWGRPCIRPHDTETTALGAALLCGLGTGLWSGPDQVKALLDRGATRFEPQIPADRRAALYAGWKRAVSRVLHGD